MAMAIYPLDNKPAYDIENEQLGPNDRLTEKIRTACETLVLMPADSVSAISVTSALNPDQLPAMLQMISMLAEEYGLQERVTLHDQGISIRFTRLG